MILYGGGMGASTVSEASSESYIDNRGSGVNNVLCIFKNEYAGQ